MIFAGLGLAGRILGAIPLWVYPAAALAVAYGCSQMEATRAKQKLTKAVVASAEARVQEQVDARENERALVEGVGRVTDVLSVQQQKARADARASAERMRVTAEAWAASAASAAAAGTCRSDEAPAVGILRRETREDLEHLAQDAEETRLTLLACQSVIRTERSVPSGHR